MGHIEMLDSEESRISPLTAADASNTIVDGIMSRKAAALEIYRSYDDPVQQLICGINSRIYAASILEKGYTDIIVRSNQHLGFLNKECVLATVYIDCDKIDPVLERAITQYRDAGYSISVGDCPYKENWERHIRIKWMDFADIDLLWRFEYESQFDAYKKRRPDSGYLGIAHVPRLP